MTTIDGTNNSEFLPGTPDNDTLNGFGGDDTLDGAGGNDVLDGGSGSDTLTGGEGQDTFVYDRTTNGGFTFADTVTDFILGEDVVNVAAAGIADFATIDRPEFLSEDNLGNVTISTTLNDRLNQITLLGISIADLRAGDPADSFIFAANTGDQNIEGGNRVDDLFGNIGNDTIQGFRGTDRLFGNAGDDVLDGGDDNDSLFGEAGDDLLIAGPGDDFIDGGAGTDEVLFSSSLAAYTITDDDGDFVFDVVGPDGADTLRNIENARFTDQTISLPQAPNNAPSFTSPDTVDVLENEVGVLVVVAEDDDAVTYAIAGSADGEAFAIDPLTGALTFADAPDFEVPGDANGDNTYTVEISATDSNDNLATQSLTIAVANNPFEGGAGFNLDVDLNGIVDPLTDGLNVLRSLLGAPAQSFQLGDNVPDGIIQASVVAGLSDSVEALALDFDSNGVVDPTIDGLNALRVLLGAPSQSIVIGANAPADATQESVFAAIQALA